MYVNPADELRAQQKTQVERAEEIVRSCVHCGFCNATCPTYRLEGDELDGPRGRIYLIKGLLERAEANEVAELHLSRCLTCRACETTCPSGVAYGELVEYGRELLSDHHKATFLERAMLAVVPNVRLFTALHRIARPFRSFLNPKLADQLQRKAGMRRPSDSLPARVVILQGCVQRVLTSEVAEHLAQLLDALDIGYRFAAQEKCCGAMHLHAGRTKQAQQYMRANIEAVALEPDEIVVSTASGCGVTLKDYGRALGNDPDATLLADRTMDVAEFLAEFAFEKQSGFDRIAFQSPCTLQHGQRITGVVESILRGAGYEVLESAEANQCCGSAGTYSVLKPTRSRQLRAKKLNALLEQQPDAIVTANVGCHLHLESVSPVPVLHWIQLLSR